MKSERSELVQEGLLLLPTVQTRAPPVCGGSPRGCKKILRRDESAASWKTWAAVLFTSWHAEIQQATFCLSLEIILLYALPRLYNELL